MKLAHLLAGIRGELGLADECQLSSAQFDGRHDCFWSKADTGSTTDRHIDQYTCDTNFQSNGHQHMHRASALVCGRPYQKVHVIAQRVEKLHEFFRGKVVQPKVRQGRYIRLGDSQPFGDFSLFQTQRLDAFVQPQSQHELGLVFSGIWQPKIGKQPLLRSKAASTLRVIQK